MAVPLQHTMAPQDEAGTAPEDRRFRPDVQGLRAVAILLVVLFHAAIPGVGGGYVGVDVFFVISGFVITGVLLRERSATETTSLPHFYARRVRRILPAASLVIVATVIAAFHYLGPLTGHDTAVDGQWAAVFLANFHFAASQTNYLASQQPPSALQNFWSLAVEEQFYLVYPAIFLLTASVFKRVPLRRRIGLVLLAIIVASFAYSVVFTSINAPSAFFSPLTRAWELALGGLVAASSDRLRRVPRPLAALTSWAGLAMVVIASVTLTSASVYPGALVALPVVGAGLVIAGGTAQPALGVESLLKRRPFQLLGLISYSLYLWHWPILIIATERRGVAALPVWDNVVLLLIATAAAAVTYRVLENPIRHARRLAGRRWVSIALGICLIGATLVVTTFERERPTVDLGSVAAATAGSVCPSPQPSTVARLRAAYTSEHGTGANRSSEPDQHVVVVGDSTVCSLLAGLQAVGPSYDLSVENGALVGCGVVSGEIAPYYVFDNVNVVAYTRRCQAEANRAEEVAIERFHPSLIVWGSTDERSSIVVHTSAGSKVLNSGSPQWHAVMRQRIDARVQQFLSTGARVILLSEPPAVHSTNQLDSDDIAYERMDALLDEVAAEHRHHVGVVNLGARVCPSGPPCPYLVDGIGSDSEPDTTLRPDGLHYTSAGGELWVAEWLLPRVAAEARALSP